MEVRMKNDEKRRKLREKEGEENGEAEVTLLHYDYILASIIHKKY